MDAKIVLEPYSEENMIKAAKDCLIVQVAELPKKESKILMLEEKKDFKMGKVIDSHSLPIGSYVYFYQYVGQEFEYDGQKYLSLKEEHIFAHSTELK